MRQRLEIKQGVNRGHRVYWVSCPNCGASPDKKTKISAKLARDNHNCEDGWRGPRD